MKYRVVDALRPLGGDGGFRLEGEIVKEVPFDEELSTVRCQNYCAFKQCEVRGGSVTPKDCTKCYGLEITGGALRSENGESHPIVDGIPRIFSADTRGWLKKNQNTFSLEWKMFNFGERNWGQSIETRKGLFLEALGVEPGQLKGKTIYDAGCGSGLLSMEMASSYGMEVFAVDLAYGIEQAYRRNTNPHVHFVQASILESPIRETSMDLLYCAGVLVHIPNSEKGFDAIIPCLKPGGRCFVWVYHPIDEKHHPSDKAKLLVYNWIRINLTSRLPIRLQYWLYLSLMPLFVVQQKLRNLFRSPKDTSTWREKMQALVDFFSPVYQNRHTEEEVLGWFNSRSFVQEAISYHQEFGFGARGDRPQS